VTVIDLPQRGRLTRTALKIEVFAGGNLAAADWPSIAGDLDLKMYIFQSREFLDVWLNTIGKTGSIEPYLVVVRDGAGRSVFYLPLAIETKFNIRLLRFMDAGVADYNAPILAAGHTLSRQDFNDVWSEILAFLPSFDLIDLKKIASDVLGAFNPLTLLDCAPNHESGHSILLTGPAQETNARIPLMRLRRKLDRYYRDISEIGEPRFVVNPAAAASELVMEKLFELKRRKYERTYIPDFLAAPGVERFYRQMASPHQIGKIGHLSALMVGNSVASAHLGFIGRGRFYYILPAYDTQYGRYRAGHLLLRHLIDQSTEQGIATFDLGMGDNSYKDIWATQHLALYNHERAVTTAGQVYLQMRRVRRFVKASGVGTWFRTAS
jgi:CelD/BcsL family acetyltransferase involved in cellulose biosynthesis